MRSVTRRTLANGTRVVVEHRRDSPTVAMSVTVAAGSRHEPEALCGITHFAEHMLFKGTARHDVFEIARIGNLLGGSLNASTGHDCLRLTNRVVLEDLRPGLELLRELLHESTFPQAELDRERDVILEEIAEYNDSPEELCFDNFLKALWGAHPLGRPILGTPETVERMTRADLLAYRDAMARPSRTIVSVAGGADPEAAMALAEELFGSVPADPAEAPGWEPASGQFGAIAKVERELEQTQFCLGIDAMDRRDDRRYAFTLLDVIFGGGMGSRLFNEVRERRGLAYTIGTTSVLGPADGYLMVFGSTAAEHIDEVLSVCRREADLLARTPPDADEVETARRMVIRSFLLSQENNAFHATRNADRELYGDEWISDEEVMARLRAVTPESVRDVAADLFRGREMALSLVGPGS